MTALLTSADLAPGFMGIQLLVQLSNDIPNADAPNEDVIDSESARAWEEMWRYLGGRFTRPATVPDGDPRSLLLTITRYYLYLRHPENLAWDSSGKHPVLDAYEKALAFLKDVRDGNANMTLPPITSDQVTGGMRVSSNPRIFGPTTIMGVG